MERLPESVPRRVDPGCLGSRLSMQTTLNAAVIFYALHGDYPVSTLRADRPPHLQVTENLALTSHMASLLHS